MRIVNRSNVPRALYGTPVLSRMSALSAQQLQPWTTGMIAPGESIVLRFDDNAQYEVLDTADPFDNLTMTVTDPAPVRYLALLPIVHR